MTTTTKVDQPHEALEILGGWLGFYAYSRHHLSTLPSGQFQELFLDGKRVLILGWAGKPFTYDERSSAEYCDFAIDAITEAVSDIVKSLTVLDHNRKLRKKGKK